MKGRRTALVRTASVAGMIALLATVGCGGASENAETPQPETVMVTVEKTVEKTVQSAAPTPAPAQPPSTAAAGTTTPAEADITCEVGQPCDLSGSTVAVTQVQFFRGVQNFGETLEGYFVAVDFDYTFHEDEPTRAGEPPFWLSDGDGNTYSLDTTATISYGSQAGRMLTYTVGTARRADPRRGTLQGRPGGRGLHIAGQGPLLAGHAQDREDRPPGSPVVNGTAIRPVGASLANGGAPEGAERRSWLYRFFFGL